MAMLTDDDYSYGRGKEIFNKWKDTLHLKSDGNSRDLYIYLEREEDRMEELEKKIKRYKDFFKELDSLLPRRWSEHDVIG